MEKDLNVGKTFEFCGLKYKVTEVPHSIGNPFSKCELCGLKHNGRKLCLGNSCNCGECFGWDRKDGKDVIFVLNEKMNMEAIDRILSLRKEIANLEQLEDEVKRLREHNTSLANSNRRLMEENRTLKNNLENIYININRAIKKEIYKGIDKK